MSKDIGILTKKEFEHRITTDIEFYKREMHRLKTLQKDVALYSKKYDLQYYVDLHKNQVNYRIKEYRKWGVK